MSKAGPAAPRSLAEDLRRRDDHVLAELLRARPDLVSPLPSDIAQLASRATTRVSVSRALDRLDRFTLHVVDALAVLGDAADPVTPPAIRGLLGSTVPASGIRAALATLRTQAIVWGTDDDLHLTRAAAEIIGPLPAGLGPPARQLLSSHPPARLASIATGLGLPTTGDPVADADGIATAIIERLDELLDAVGEEAVAALRTLAAGPPSGRVDNARREVDRARAQTPIDHLLATGLVVPTDESTVILPREIALHLRGGVLHATVRAEPPSPPGAEREPAAVDRTAGAGAYDTVRRVEALLDAWAAQPPPVLRTGGLGVRDHRRLPSLLDLDETGAALIAELAYAAGLVSTSGGQDDVWLPTPAYDAWLLDDPVTRWTALVTAWLATSRAAGLVGTRDDRDRLVAPLGRDLDRPLAPEVRRLVLDTLAALPPGAAPEREGVLEVIRWRRPRRGGRLRDDLVRWTVREAETLGVTGNGALAAHVRPLLSGDPPEAALKASRTALATVLPEPLDHVLLQADLTAVAPGPLRPDLARELASMADLESRGGASVHRFSPGSMRRALDAGRSAAEIHEFLVRVSRTPVPQPLSYLVDDTARRHGLLRVGAASAFIRCDDQAVLEAILADPAAIALGVRRIAPTVLASELDPSTLLDRLRGMGFAPAPEATDGSVVIAKATARRAPARAVPPPHLASRPAPAGALLVAAVRAVRAGDRTSAGRPPDAAPGRLGKSGSARTLAELRDALTQGVTVWIGYVDNHGATSERVVDPVRIEGGWLAAFDHRSGEIRSFAVHRISGVAPVDAA